MWMLDECHIVQSTIPVNFFVFSVNAQRRAGALFPFRRSQRWQGNLCHKATLARSLSAAHNATQVNFQAQFAQTHFETRHS